MSKLAVSTLVLFQVILLSGVRSAHSGVDHEYARVAFTDSTCEGSEEVGSLSIEELKRLCDARKDCRGFNDRGEIKKDVSVACRQHTDEDRNLFVKLQPVGEWEKRSQAPITPQPLQFTSGKETVALAQPFVFSYNSTTAGVNNILQAAEERYTPLLFPHVISSPQQQGKKQLQGIRFSIKNETLDLGLSTNESYQLSIPAEGTVEVIAETVFGCLRGLETFSQLVELDIDSNQYVINKVPWEIFDQPRFAHRGMLLDTARHYHSMPVLKRFVDSLSYAKYNVFHWHIVDSQAFPLQLNSLPLLVKGAYTPQETYSPGDVAELVNYAMMRGVRVLPEFDTPGHAESWCTGYPDICPSPNCTQPLNPATNATFQLIETLLTEAKTLWTDEFVHLGGDEVHAKCWNKTPSIVQWMASMHFNTTDAYKYFVKRTHEIARVLGRKSIHWEEVFNHFGSELDNDTVIQVWLSHSTAAKIVNAGLRCILSNSGIWYLPHLKTSWEAMYSNDPYMGITDPKAQKRMIGGELCMWGETVDDSDLFNTVWPRAAAGAERLWSSANVQDTDSFKPRLVSFRCLLNRRGIGAAAVNNTEARAAPPGPGSCFAQ